MKVDLSRYSECPNCHTFQGSLKPCRKCGWHVDYKEFTHEPDYKSIRETVSKPAPKPKATYLSKELAMLRRLEDGQWHSMVELRRKCLIDRWGPKFILWQRTLEASGIIGYDKIPTRSRPFYVRIVPDRMQDAKKRMAELEESINGEN